MSSLYYGTMLMVAAFLQDTLEGFVPSIFLSAFAFVSIPLHSFIVSSGFGFFSAVIIIELLAILILLPYVNRDSKICKWAIGVLLLSIFINLFYMFMPADWYIILKGYYSVITIVLWELLLLVSLSQSRVKEFIKFLFKKKEVEK